MKQSHRQSRLKWIPVAPLQTVAFVDNLEEMHSPSGRTLHHEYGMIWHGQVVTCHGRSVRLQLCTDVLARQNVICGC